MTQDWIIYLLESAVILMFFWIVYWLFLRTETFFKLNRIYLQVTLLLGMVIPLIDWVIDIKSADVINVYIVDTIVVTAQQVEVGAIKIINHFQWIPLILLAGTEAKVFVEFIIGKDGQIQSPKVIKTMAINGSEITIDPSVKEDLESASIDAVLGLKKWKPGMQRGETVKVKMVIPIAFKLN